MQQYPNYFQMGYPNNFNQQIPNSFNPYMQRMDHLQNMQQQMQMSNQFSTLGKMVESVDMVKTIDIPMDGNLYYFPKADNSEIYAKQWLANGTTQILTFKPVLSTSQENVQQQKEMANPGLSDGIANMLMQRLDEINERFDKLEKAIKPGVKGKRDALDE